MSSAESFLMMLPQSIPPADRAAMGMIAEALDRERIVDPYSLAAPLPAAAALDLSLAGGNRESIREAAVQLAAISARLIADRCLPEMEGK